MLLALTTEEKAQAPASVNVEQKLWDADPTNHSDALPPSSSPVKTSDNLEEFADELTLLKKGVHEENFQVYSNPLFEFDDNFTSSNENPLFNEMVEDVENKNSNVSNSDEPVLLNTPLTDKYEEGYFDSEGDVIFLENLLSDDTTHNLAPEVISDHESIHNTSITFSPRSDPLHHEFAGELITLPSRISSITISSRISYSPLRIITPFKKRFDIFPVPDGFNSTSVENEGFQDEDNSIFLPENESSILEPSSPRPPPEPPDVCLNFKPDTAIKNDEDFNQGEIVLSLIVEDVNSFTFGSRGLSIFDPDISTFLFLLRSSSDFAHLRTNESGDRCQAM
ncbi:hypothetical protein Tco_0877359 [Tanacetum coccineum]|uniref:Uncharacterized protein n=1 Tax=Tanacetum coccineum TaxID=301880 RepID=A0ABQ5BWD4_9ASTR